MFELPHKGKYNKKTFTDKLKWSISWLQFPRKKYMIVVVIWWL